jgi:hypothetical protein
MCFALGVLQPPIANSIRPPPSNGQIASERDQEKGDPVFL